MQIVVVLLDVLLLLSTFVVMVAIAAAIVQMLRTKRRHYLLVAIAIFAWALSSWAGVAEFIPFLRDLLGAWTLFAMIALAQLIFIGLTLFVFQHVWGWLFPHRDAGSRDRRD